MICRNKLLFVGVLFGSIGALYAELPPDQSKDSALAMEKISPKEVADEDDLDDDSCGDPAQDRDLFYLVENDIRDLVRHGSAHTPHGFSEVRLAGIEYYVIVTKLYRLTGYLAFPLDLEEVPPYAVMFNRSMSSIELKEALDKVGGDKILTGESTPLTADSEIIREIQACAGTSHLRDLFDTQNIRDEKFIKEQLRDWLQEAGGNYTLDELKEIYHLKKNYGFLKERWEPFFRVAGVDFSLEGVAALYKRDMEKNSIEKRIIVDYIRERKFAFINKDTKVTKLPELYQYTEDGHHYIIWSIEIDHQKNFIIYRMDKDGNIEACTVDKNIPIDELDFYDNYREPIWE